jgi:SAM-dependent methyltransferase
MELRRKPFQGVLNIIRFNWHFYLIAGICVTILAFCRKEIPDPFRDLVTIISFITVSTVVISLAVSCYIYDFSKLYNFDWLPPANFKTALNINAGFDETSTLLKQKYQHIDLTICDFYNPIKHTEISLRRARIAYPPLENTLKVSTEKLPFNTHTFDIVYAIFSAHEIRNQEERTRFFKELNRITKSDGCIFVTEHLRDRNNFLAYTVGFFHFYSKKTWKETFELSELKIETEIKTTPFVTTFKLLKYGNSF